MNLLVRHSCACRLEGKNQSERSTEDAVQQKKLEAVVTSRESGIRNPETSSSSSLPIPSIWKRDSSRYVLQCVPRCVLRTAQP
eukprot:scaffold66914_cov33-Attheya_sp.AAC.1